MRTCGSRCWPATAGNDPFIFNSFNGIENLSLLSFEKDMNTSEENLWLVRLDETPLGFLDLSFSAKGLCSLEIIDAEEVFPFVIPGLIHSTGDPKSPDRLIGVVNDALGEIKRYFKRHSYGLCRSPPGPQGHPLPTPGLAGTPKNSLGGNHQLRGFGQAPGKTQGRQGRGPGLRRQPHPPHRPLPPGHRPKRHLRWLQLRPGAQTLAA
jgi:hypothetical protein